MYHYIQIDENGYVVSDSWLSGEVIADNMILVADDFDPTNKRYVNGEWVEYTPEPIPEPEPMTTQLDVIEESQLIIMEAMADQYEQQLEDNLVMLEVQATIYEEIIGLKEGE